MGGPDGGVLCQKTLPKAAPPGMPPGMHWKGGRYPPPPPSRAPSLRPATAFVIDSNRPQPLRQPPPTACVTASGAASEAPSLLMHPWMPPPLPQVTFTIKELHIVQEEAPKQVMLSFQVCNAANPARPAVTPGYIAKVLAGKADTAGPSSRALSDRIGLQHSFLAADAHNMTISFTQTGSTVLFDLQVRGRRDSPNNVS